MQIGSVQTGKGERTMPDRKMVIKGLENCLNPTLNCRDKKDSCPYARQCWLLDPLPTIRVKKDALALLKEQPEIVRCKDCVYHENEKARSNQTAWLPCMEMQTKNNWYCADGVKKDE